LHVNTSVARSSASLNACARYFDLYRAVVTNRARTADLEYVVTRPKKIDLYRAVVTNRAGGVNNRRKRNKRVCR
jgi:hypothetical protein